MMFAIHVFGWVAAFGLGVLFNDWRRLKGKDLQRQAQERNVARRLEAISHGN